MTESTEVWSQKELSVKITEIAGKRKKEIDGDEYVGERGKKNGERRGREESS